MYFDTIDGIINNICPLNSDLRAFKDVLLDVCRIPFEDMMFKKYDLKTGRLSFSQYLTKSKKSEKYESHREFCDLHMLLYGEELFYYSRLEDRNQDNYDSEKDISLLLNFYDNENFVKLYNGMGILVTPWDAHMPGISVMPPQKSYLVKKLVIKIPWHTIAEEAGSLGI